MGFRLLLALSCALPMLFASAVPVEAAPIGSYTVNLGANGATPGLKIRITAKAGNTAFDQEFTFGGGETSEQVRNTIRTALEGDGWSVQPNGTNGLNITNNGADKISKVDGGTNLKSSAGLSLDGSNVTLTTAIPGDKNFKVGFEGGLGTDTALALVQLDLDGLAPFSKLVPASPSQAAQSFFDVFVTLGFPDAQLIGNEISFSKLPNGTQVTGIEAFFTDSPALHLGITIPDPVPEPASLGLLATGAAALAMRRRRERAMAR